MESYEYNGYRYRIRIKEISALDLAQTFEVVINEEKTVTLSALSYGKLAVKRNVVNTVNAVKALYEFYRSTVKYNEKPTAPDDEESYGDMTWG